MRWHRAPASAVRRPGNEASAGASRSGNAPCRLAMPISSAHHALAHRAHVVPRGEAEVDLVRERVPEAVEARDTGGHDAVRRARPRGVPCRSTTTPWRSARAGGDTGERRAQCLDVEARRLGYRWAAGQPSPRRAGTAHGPAATASRRAARSAHAIPSTRPRAATCSTRAPRRSRDRWCSARARRGTARRPGRPRRSRRLRPNACRRPSARALPGGSRARWCRRS